jgi:hypothetical protein
MQAERAIGGRVRRAGASVAPRKLRDEPFAGFLGFALK